MKGDFAPMQLASHSSLLTDDNQRSCTVQRNEKLVKLARRSFLTLAAVSAIFCPKMKRFRLQLFAAALPIGCLGTFTLPSQNHFHIFIIFTLSFCSSTFVCLCLPFVFLGLHISQASRDFNGITQWRRRKEFLFEARLLSQAP